MVLLPFLHPTCEQILYVCNKWMNLAKLTHSAWPQIHMVDHVTGAPKKVPRKRATRHAASRAFPETAKAAIGDLVSES